MPCLALFFDAMSGVKKLANLYPAIYCPTSAFEPFFEVYRMLIFDDNEGHHC